MTARYSDVLVSFCVNRAYPAAVLCLQFVRSGQDNKWEHGGNRTFKVCMNGSHGMKDEVGGSCCIYLVPTVYLLPSSIYVDDLPLVCCQLHMSQPS